MDSYLEVIGSASFFSFLNNPPRALMACLAVTAVSCAVAVAAF